MAAFAIAAGLVFAAPQAISPRDALWIIVHYGCVPNLLQNHDPKPCVSVDLDEGIDRGSAVLKDIEGATQFFLVPTARISGIESPILSAANAPNYFAAAWEARMNIDKVLQKTLPRDDIGVAVNSIASRSQDQLHIHIDCIRPDVKETLREHEASISNQWAPLNGLFPGHSYQAMWIAGDQLGSNNPFRFLEEVLPRTDGYGGDRTLVVVGFYRANGAAGFVMLADQVNQQGQDFAHGEELLDHTCRIATLGLMQN